MSYSRRKRGLTPHLVAAGSMLAGTSLIFGALYYMNEHGSLGPPVERSDRVAFEVAPPPPKKTPKPKPPEHKRSPKNVTPRAAPAPNIGSSLAGLSFDLPGFEASDLGSVGNDVLGAEGSKNMVMTEEAVDKKPTPRKQVAPGFPPKARQRGIEGYVKVNLFISASGAVEKVRVLESEPRGIFEESATVAAQQWEFDPAQYNGAPVAGWFKRTISFRLN